MAVAESRSTSACLFNGRRVFVFSPKRRSALDETFRLKLDGVGLTGEKLESAQGLLDRRIEYMAGYNADGTGARFQ